MDVLNDFPDKYWDVTELLMNTFTKEKEKFDLICKHRNFVQENIFEDVVKIAMHPSKIEKYLNMGYSIDDFDNIL